MIDNKNDWLSKEIEREKKKSFWDLDEPNKVRSLHEENCPREKLEKEHQNDHEGNEEEIEILNRIIHSDDRLLRQKRIVNIIAWFFIILFLILMLIISNS